MSTDNELNILTSTAQALSTIMPMEEEMHLRSHYELPSVDVLHQMMQHVKGIIFPQFFGSDIMVDLSCVYNMLREQIAHGLASTNNHDCGQADPQAARLALQFVQHLPEIKRLLLTDVAAVTHNDPAASNHSEAVFCYPVVQEMVHYRAAHQLYVLGVPMLPRIITEIAHSLTGIDIHPAAQIGEYFAIDHGTGVVIGETSIIGNHVMLYQGVTLGARNFQYDDQGLPLDVPRHPIVEDNVTIYSNTSILGRVTIGHDSIIGGNTWITHDVPPHSTITQSKAVSQ